MRTLLLLTLFFALTACASASKRPVDVVSFVDAKSLSLDVAAYVAGELPPASSNITIIPSALPSPNLDSALAHALRDRGFAVFDGTPADPAGHRLSAAADPFDGGYILRLELDGNLITRLYGRTASADLEPASVFAKRTAP